MSDSNVTVFGGDVKMPTASALAGALKKSSETSGGQGFDYLNFSGKMGRYSAGRDKRNLEEGEKFIPNIAAFEDGWMCWKGNAPVETRMANISADPVETPDMNEHGPFGKNDGGWSPAKRMMLKAVDGGTQYQFTTSSISGVNVFADLQQQIGERAERGEAAWPIISFSAETFTAQGIQNYKPKITVRGWLDDNNVGLALGDDAVDVTGLMESPNGGDAADAKPKRGKL